MVLAIARMIRVITYFDSSASMQLDFPLETVSYPQPKQLDFPLETVSYPQPKHKKHNPFNPALNHRNKHRYIKARKLSRR